MYLPLFCLLLGAFSIGTTELVVSGLLPAIAADLGVSIAAAGLLVTVYALGVVFGGPAAMAVVQRWPRRRAILAVLAAFFVAHLVCAFAPGFALLMAGRVLAAAAHGCFFGLAITLATGLAPPGRQATALSIVVGGLSIANILGVPLGTAVGNAFGWRSTFLLIAGFTLVAAAAIAAFVPDAPASGRRLPLAGQIRVLLNRKVITAYAMIILQMVALFGLLTFIAPWLDEVGGIGPDDLPVVLMLFGLTGAVGMFAGGRLTDIAPRPSLIAGYALAAVALALGWALLARAPAAGIAALAAMSLLSSIAALGAQARVLAGAAKAPELAATLMSSVFNIGIALGAGLAAWAIAAGMPLSRLPVIGVVSLIGALCLAVWAVLSDHRSGP